MQDDGSSSIIVDHDVLGESYVPAKLKAREAQSEQIMCCLSPVITKHKPIHTWLHGKAGTGKTSTAMHVLRHLDERNSVKSIYINCFKHDTFYEILDAIISQFRVLRADEHSTSFKLEKLLSFLKDRPFVVVLDEVDQVKPRELSSVLYNLDSMLNAGIVCLSDSTRSLMELEERVRSRLNPHTISFPAYPHQALVDIPVTRLNVDFHRVRVFMLHRIHRTELQYVMTRCIKRGRSRYRRSVSNINGRAEWRFNQGPQNGGHITRRIRNRSVQINGGCAFFEPRHDTASGIDLRC